MKYTAYARPDDQAKAKKHPFDYGLSDEWSIQAETEKDAYRLAVLRFAVEYPDEKLDTYSIGISW